MSRTFHYDDGRIRVRGIRKDPPDLRRLARALIALAEAQAETEAEAEAQARIQTRAEVRAKRNKARRTVKHPRDEDNSGNQGDAA